MELRIPLAGALALCIAAAACGRAEQSPDAEQAQSPPAPAAAETEAVEGRVSPEPKKGAAAKPELDVAALRERRDPERLLRFYSSAIQASEWELAARAWSSDAQVTAKKLAQVYGGGAKPKFAFGKGDIEGAAGSQFYEAPIAVTFPDGRPERRGTIVLRRVNDVDGASEEQLNWRIERSTVLTTP